MTSVGRSFANPPNRRRKQLVPRSQHNNGTIFQEVLHPNRGGGFLFGASRQADRHSCKAVGV